MHCIAWQNTFISQTQELSYEFQNNPCTPSYLYNLNDPVHLDIHTDLNDCVHLHIYTDLNDICVPHFTLTLAFLWALSLSNNSWIPRPNSGSAWLKFLTTLFCRKSVALIAWLAMFSTSLCLSAGFRTCKITKYYNARLQVTMATG